MEKERKGSHNIVLVIIAAITLIVAMVGATFAYFSAVSTAEKQQITSGELKIAANSSIENNSEIKPTKWDGDDINEITEENKKDIAVVSLTVKTDGTTIDKSSYDIYLNATGIKLNTAEVQVDQAGTKKQLSGGSLNDVMWALYDDDNDNFIGSGNFGESSVTDENGVVKDLKVNESGSISITPNVDTTHNYKLYIWIQDTDVEQNQLQDLTIEATLRAEAKQAVLP